MTSTVERLGTISLSEEQSRVRTLPSGSRVRKIGALWLMWLRHIQRCQTEGITAAGPRCTRHQGLVTALDAAYPQWVCCDTHRALKEEREQILVCVQKMNLHGQSAPHQSDDLLSVAWWRDRNYRFDIRRQVIN